MPIILASASPRRKELLAAAGITCEVRPVDVDETRQAGENARLYVARVAALKADEAFMKWPDEFILAADTAVKVGSDVLGKPGTTSDALSMLRSLNGRAHEVLTGVAIRSPRGHADFVETTGVRFRALSEAELAWYVASGEPMDKAGAYAIQGLGSRFVATISGSYSNVVGLPVAAVVEALTRLGALGDAGI